MVSGPTLARTHSSFPDSHIHVSLTASATSCFGAVQPDIQHSIATLLCTSFHCPERHKFFRQTLPPVQPSFCVSPPHSLSEAPSVPVFVFRRFFLDPSLVFPSLPVRNHPRSSRSDYNLPSTVFSLFFIVDKESRCFHSTQGFDIDIQFIALTPRTSVPRRSPASRYTGFNR